jgi:hypothetical protein
MASAACTGVAVRQALHPLQAFAQADATKSTAKAARSCGARCAAAEASRFLADRAKATPTTPAAGPLKAAEPRRIEGYGKMSMAQKLAAAGHL